MMRNLKSVIGSVALLTVSLVLAASMQAASSHAANAKPTGLALMKFGKVSFGSEQLSSQLVANNVEELEALYWTGTNPSLPSDFFIYAGQCFHADGTEYSGLLWGMTDHDIFGDNGGSPLYKSGMLFSYNNRYSEYQSQDDLTDEDWVALESVYEAYQTPDRDNTSWALKSTFGSLSQTAWVREVVSEGAHYFLARISIRSFGTIGFCQLSQL